MFKERPLRRPRGKPWLQRVRAARTRAGPGTWQACASLCVSPGPRAGTLSPGRAVTLRRAASPEDQRCAWLLPAREAHGRGRRGHRVPLGSGGRAARPRGVSDENARACGGPSQPPSSWVLGRGPEQCRGAAPWCGERAGVADGGSTGPGRRRLDKGLKAAGVSEGSGQSRRRVPGPRARVGAGGPRLPSPPS